METIHSHQIRRRVYSKFERLSGKKFHTDAELIYFPVTRFIIKKDEEDYLTPFVTKFSPYTHLFSVTGGEGGTLSFAKCDVALRNQMVIQNPLTPISGIAENTILDISFLDEQTIAIGSADCAVRYIDLTTFNTLNTFYAHAQSVKTLCNSTEGKVFSGGRDGLIFEWSKNEKQPCLSIALKKNTSSVTSIIMPNDNMLISSYSSNSLVAWDLRNPSKMLLQIPVPTTVTSISSLAMSPDKQLMASISTNNFVTIHKIDGEWSTIQRRGEGLDTYYNKICFSPCGRYVLTGSSLGSLTIFPINPRFEPVKLLGHSMPATYVDWDKDYDHIISCSDDKTVQIWSAEYEPIPHNPDIQNQDFDYFEEEPIFEPLKEKRTSKTSTNTLLNYYQRI